MQSCECEMEDVKIFQNKQICMICIIMEVLLGIFTRWYGLYM